jgi:very-short-patch-repair endonuclease/predicted transcriptional regulator of viral defense system
MGPNRGEKRSPRRVGEDEGRVEAVIRPQFALRVAVADEGDVVREIDRRIARLAARQRGVVTHAQLIALGLSKRAVAHRIRAGKLHPLYRGVYLVGHAVPVLGARELGAVLACGPDAYISHRSAGAIYGVADPDPAVIDISVIGRSRRQRDGIRVHRPTTLRPSDTGIVDKFLPITSPARTLIDFAATAPFRDVEYAVNESQIKKLVTAKELEAKLHGQRGAAAITAILSIGAAKVHKGGETLLRTLIRKANFPTPEINVKVHGYEWDFHWPHAKLVVEADSVRYHSLPSKVEHDRRKEAHLRARDYEVLRFTYTQIAYEPEVVIAGIATALAKATATQPR